MSDHFELDMATIQAEESLLGAIIIQSSGGDKTAINQVSAILQVTDFSGCFMTVHPYNWPIHARIYYAMLKCEKAPHQINVAQQMDKLDILRKEDCFFMARYITRVPCSLDYMDYALAVKEYSKQRQIKYHASKGNYQKLNKLTQSDFEDGIKL